MLFYVSLAPNGTPLAASEKPLKCQWHWCLGRLLPGSTTSRSSIIRVALVARKSLARKLPKHQRFLVTGGSPNAVVGEAKTLQRRSQPTVGCIGAGVRTNSELHIYITSSSINKTVICHFHFILFVKISRCERCVGRVPRSVYNGCL